MLCWHRVALGLAVCNVRTSGARHLHMLTDTTDRLSRHLDLVTLEAPPRVELTSARGGNPTADELRPSPSSTPPSTRPRARTERILAAAARQFHLPASLLLLAEQN